MGVIKGNLNKETGHGYQFVSLIILIIALIATLFLEVTKIGNWRMAIYLLTTGFVILCLFWFLRIIYEKDREKSAKNQTEQSKRKNFKKRQELHLIAILIGKSILFSFFLFFLLLIFLSIFSSTFISDLIFGEVVSFTTGLFLFSGFFVMSSTLSFQFLLAEKQGRLKINKRIKIFVITALLFSVLAYVTRVTEEFDIIKASIFFIALVLTRGLKAFMFSNRRGVSGSETRAIELSKDSIFFAILVVVMLVTWLCVEKYFI